MTVFPAAVKSTRSFYKCLQLDSFLAATTRDEEKSPPSRTEDGASSSTSGERHGKGPSNIGDACGAAGETVDDGAARTVRDGGGDRIEIGSGRTTVNHVVQHGHEQARLSMRPRASFCRGDREQFLAKSPQGSWCSRCPCWITPRRLLCDPGRRRNRCRCLVGRRNDLQCGCQICR